MTTIPANTVEQVHHASRRVVRLAWGLATLALLLMIGAGVLSAATGTKIGIAIEELVFFFVFAIVFAGLGALIASRHPRNAIGWLFLGMAVTLGVGWVAGAYADYGIKTRSGSGLLVRTAALFSDSSWIPLIMVPATFLILLFPDGRLLSRRWRPIAWCAGLGIAGAQLAAVFSPDPLSEYPQLTSPFGVHSRLVDVAVNISFLLLMVGILGSIVSLIIRFRRAPGQERQQIKWLAFAGAVAAVVVPMMVAFLYEAMDETVATLIVMSSVLGLPVAAGVAILRYRLYDIDVVINKSVVLVVLVGFITAVYAVIVVGLGSLLPVGDGNLGLAIVATALVAVVFEPVRLRVQHWANRLVYGRRASPYETLAAMTEKIGDSVDPGDALGEAARLLAEGTGAAQAVVWVARDGVLTARATAGDDSGDPEPVALVGGELPVLVGVALVEPVRHEGKLVGALSLAKRPGEGVNSTDRRLVTELAGQAALLLANTRLRSRLGERLVELRISRQRMITAQDRARHALERDLHDGAQQELVALKVKLGLARTIATREGVPAVAQELDDTAQIADRAVDTLRDVARGIYPPLLESEGLAAALSAQARRAGLSVTVLDRAQIRYPRELEATAYFCALEALRNAVKHADATHAHVELNGTQSDLVVTVTDDGNGFDPDTITHGDGLTHMADRVDATGGTLSIDSTPNHGTTITLNLPVHAAAPELSDQLSTTAG
jgi:signal transduction histidine kinase